jgi:hypothetical protein
MKKIYSIVLTLFLLGLWSCEKDFKEINTNPNASTIASSAFLFSNAQLNTLNTGQFETSLLNCGGFLQHFATYKEVSGVGDKYLANDAYHAVFFQEAFPNSVNQINEVLRATTSANDINKNAIARIWKVYIMHRITDLYGDIPYSEAGRGYPDLIFTPKYDAQAAIYANMLSELEASTKAFDATKPSFGAADLIYAGDVAKWKKLGYSLMLRLSMRMTKVDNAQAKTWVQKAIAGGVILSSADNAVIKYTDGPQNYNRNPFVYTARTRDFVANSFGRTNIEGGKYSKTFIDYLVKAADPRLNVISGVWINKIQDNSTAVQKGFQNGLSVAPSPDALGTFSEPLQTTIFKMDAPAIVLGNAEIQLLLAEASVRGWNSASDEELYKSAITASLNNYQIYGANAVIAPDKITAFLAGKSLTGTMDEKLEKIHTEFWVSLFGDEIEAFSNWRRTGFPKLTPINYPGNATSGTIPRRIIYPNVESASNATNYQAALVKQGPDLLTTRVWWDTK